MSAGTSEKSVHAPNSRVNSQDVARRTQHIDKLRILLPSLAGLAVIGYFVSLRPPHVDISFEKDFSQIGMAADKMQMENLRYSSEDEKGVPFQVSAKSATQDIDNLDIIALDNPGGLQDENGNDILAVTAASGKLHTEDNQLHLDSDVRLEHEIGSSAYVFQTDKAQVSLDDKTISSKSGVYGKGPDGSIKANEFSADQRDGRMVFQNNVQMRIIPKKKSASSSDKASTKTSSAASETADKGENADSVKDDEAEDATENTSAITPENTPVNTNGTVPGDASNLGTPRG